MAAMQLRESPLLDLEAHSSRSSTIASVHPQSAPNIIYSLQRATQVLLIEPPPEQYSNSQLTTGRRHTAESCCAAVRCPLCRWVALPVPSRNTTAAAKCDASVAAFQ